MYEYLMHAQVFRVLLYFWIPSSLNENVQSFHT